MLIGELAERSGATRRALRYYEEQGLLHSERTTNGYRRYGPDAVQRVVQIRALLRAGFGSELVRQLLPCAVGWKPTIELCPSVVAEMEAVLESVEVQLEDLEQRRQSIRGLLA